MKSTNPILSFPYFYPCELDFDFLYHYYFDFITRDVFSLFEFTGVPDTINETFLKYCIFLGGKATFFQVDSGELVALNGTYSDRPDLYYLPEKMLVANPRLDKTYVLTRDEQCVVVYCSETDIYTTTDRFGGLYSLIAKTATMLADNDLSISVAQKNTRLINILAAEDQQTKDSIDRVLHKQYRGEPAAVVMKSLIDNVQSVPLTTSTSNQYLVQLVELHQYILSHFYEAIGLSTHDNMKKERLIRDELNDNDSLSKLNMDNMMKTIKHGLDKVNEMYGTNITITLNPLLEPEKQELEADGNEDESRQTTEESKQTTDATDAQERAEKEPEEEPTEELSESETQEPEQHEVETKEQEDNPHHKPHENIEINISLEDEATADISIDTGGDELGDNERVPEMVDDSGDDTGHTA